MTLRCRKCSSRQPDGYTQPRCYWCNGQTEADEKPEPTPMSWFPFGPAPLPKSDQ